MKKCLALLALVALAFQSDASILKTYKNPKDGDRVEIRNGGRLSSVDVFSTEPSGTVEISRIFSMDVYTNAYDITTEIVTNVIEHEVLNTNYLSGAGDVYYYDPTKASWDAVCQWTNTAGNVIRWINSQHKNFPLNVHIIVGGVDKYKMMNEMGQWESLNFTGYIEGFDDAQFSMQTNLDHYDYSTNVVTVVTTNSVTKIFSNRLTVTNEVFTGSCSNNCLHAKPDPDVWLFPDDEIFFKGTATGGALRLVIE